jgi:hypothetical protein
VNHDEGTADDTMHRLQFAGHIRQIEHVTLVADTDGAVLGVVDMEDHQRLGDHLPQRRVSDLVVTERARPGDRDGAARAGRC